MQHIERVGTTAIPPKPTPINLGQRVRRLRRFTPLVLLGLVLFNELGLSPWTAQRLGDTAAVVLHILLYGSVGPVLAYLLLTVMGRWLEERETSFEQREPGHDKSEDAGPVLQRPQAKRDDDPDDACRDPKPAPQPDVLERRQVAQRSEPVEAERSKAEEQVVEPGECAEEPDDRDQDRWIPHVLSLLR